MKIRVKQAHQTPQDGRWIDHPVGQELEIEEGDFAANLHERIEPEARPKENKTAANSVQED